jgi:Transposase DDE domain
VPDFAGVSEDDLSRGVGTVGRQSEIAESLGDAVQTAALHDAPEVQRAEPGIGDSRRDDSDDWAVGGRAEVCEDRGRDGCDRDGDDDGQRAFSEPSWSDAAEMGESLHYRVVWRFAAVEFGVGLGTGQRQMPSWGVYGQGKWGDLPAKLYADAGYDAEWVHDQCRLDWGAERIIKPAKQRADGTRSGFWRSRMSEKYLARKGYGSRWAVESFFSGLKRTMGSALTSRKPSQLLAEAAFKVLAYTLRH